MLSKIAREILEWKDRQKIFADTVTSNIKDAGPDGDSGQVQARGSTSTASGKSS